LASSLAPKIRSAPAATLTLAGSSVALAFNLGFFDRVGTAFISLFTLQEHVVFSLTNALLTMALSLSVCGLVCLLHVVPKVGTSTARLDYWVFYAWWIATYDLILIAATIGFFREIGEGAAWATFSIIVIVSLVTAFCLLSSLSEAKLPLIFLSSVVVSALSGYVYAEYCITTKRSDYKSYAVARDERVLGLVRAGAEYSLVVSSDGVVHAMRTDELAQMFFVRECAAEACPKISD
jgi:hypothetical protein